MKVIGLHHYGDPDVLEQIELPEPHAGPGQLRIKVVAAAVNPVDTLIRSGAAAAAFAHISPPYIPGLDAAGILDEIGTGTRTSLSLGDAVMALVNPTRPAGGAYAEYVVLPTEYVVAAPLGSTAAEAATLPLNGLTARRALDLLALPPGRVVAITGAAGGVGGFAVQLAKADGLQVIADASDADRELVEALGADHVVSRGSLVAERFREIATGGVDGIVDAALVGSSLATAIRGGGGLAQIRGGGGLVELERGISGHSVNVHDYDGDRATLDCLGRQAEAGLLSLRVAEIMPATQAARAHRLLAAGGVRGRLVLRFG